MASAHPRPNSRRDPPFDLLAGFAPFVLFVLLTRLSVDLALWTSFATAFAVGVRALVRTRMIRTLDAGSVAVFGLLAVVRAFAPGLDVSVNRLTAEASLFTIALFSLVARRPFTLNYVREGDERQPACSPSLKRANYRITFVWMLAFALMAGADAAAIFDRRISVTFALAAGLLVMTAALTFTWRYPVPQPILRRTK